MKRLINLTAASAQNTLIGVIALFVPGMFLALNGLGAGGLADASVNSNALTAMYIAFGLTGIFLSGILNNTFGHRISLLLGCGGYLFYVFSLWMYHWTMNATLVLSGGFILGTCASLFWVSQGSIMMSYPLESEKGQFIASFRIIYTFGGVFGALLSFGLNFTNESTEVLPSTYGLFMGLMVGGFFLSLLIHPTSKIIRSDGTRMNSPAKPALKDHIFGLVSVFTDWRILMLSPLFLLSNFYYPYQFNVYNGTLFNIRTRSLNNALYWLTQIIAAPVWGFLLDYHKLSKKQRGCLAITILSTLSIFVWVCGYFIQTEYSITSPPSRIDFTASTYPPRLFVYLGYSLVDYLVQASLFWILGALSSNPHVLSRYFGYYGGIQSIGSAIAWRINAVGTEFMTEFIINSVILVLACISTFVVVIKLKDDTESLEVDTSDANFNNDILDQSKTQ